MTLRKRYLGLVAAAALLVPAMAYGATPDIVDGSAGTGDLMIGHFNGVTTEIAGTIGSGNNGGSCTVSGCAETTWGVGVVSQVQDNVTNNVTWNQGQNSQSLGFVLYGVADLSDTTTNNGDGTFTTKVQNTGATTSTFGATDGNIHLDLYYMPSSSTPCFSAGCGANEITTAARSANTAGGVAQVAGITNQALFASFTFIAGTSANSNVQMAQSITTNASGQIVHNGGNANFYALCTGGPGCAQFGKVPESAFQQGSFFAALISSIFGQINVKNSNATNQFTIGWLFDITDPVNFFATVPEPTSLGMLGSALVLFGIVARRRRNGSAG